MFIFYDILTLGWPKPIKMFTRGLHKTIFILRMWAYDNRDTMTEKAKPPTYAAFLCGSQVGGVTTVLTKNRQCVIMALPILWLPMVWRRKEPCYWERYLSRKISVSVPELCLRFVIRSDLWLRHDLWPQSVANCDPAQFVTKSAAICDWLFIMILECKLWRGKFVFVSILMMYTKWYA